MPELTVPELRQYVTREAPIILEIGANDGEDTARFMETFPGCRLYCFECDDRAILKWRTRFGLAGENRNPALIEVALSDDDSRAEFYPSGGDPPNCDRPDWKDWDKSGSLLKPTGHLSYSPWVTFGVPVRVMTMKLDTWMEYGHVGEREEIDFVWCDVQGAEAKVIRGARRSLHRLRYLYLECHPQQLYDGAPSEQTLKDMLPLHDCLGRYADNLLFRRKDLWP